MRTPPVLFHGMPRPASGDAILPGTKYGTNIGDRVREKLGVPPGSHPPLVFASPHLAHAVAFATALQGVSAPLLFGLYDVQRAAYFGIFGNRDVFMQAALTGVVYAFASDGFVPLERSVNHFVGLNPVPFARTQRAAEITCAADAMRHGLQIFTHATPYPKTPGDPPLPDMRSFSFPDGLRALVASGELVWENDARGIAPDPQLRQILGLAR